MRKCSQVQKRTEPRPAAPSSAAVWGLPGPVHVSDTSSVPRVPLLSLALSWCHSGHLHIVCTHCPRAAGSWFTGAQLAKQKYTPATWISSSLPTVLAESSPRKETLPMKSPGWARGARGAEPRWTWACGRGSAQGGLCTSHGLCRLILLRPRPPRLILLRSGCRGSETRRPLPASRGRRKEARGFCPPPLLEAWGQETLQLSQGVGLPTSLFTYFSILDKQLTFPAHVFFDCLGFTSVSSSFDLGAWWQICNNHHWQKWSHSRRLISGSGWPQERIELCQVSMISASESVTGQIHFPFLTVRDEWKWSLSLSLSLSLSHTHTRVLQQRTASFLKCMWMTSRQGISSVLYPCLRPQHTIEMRKPSIIPFLILSM